MKPTPKPSSPSAALSAANALETVLELLSIGDHYVSCCTNSQAVMAYSAYAYDKQDPIVQYALMKHRGQAIDPRPIKTPIERIDFPTCTIEVIGRVIPKTEPTFSEAEYMAAIRQLEAGIVEMGRSVPRESQERYNRLLKASPWLHRPEPMAYT